MAPHVFFSVCSHTWKESLILFPCKFVHPLSAIMHVLPSSGIQGGCVHRVPDSSCHRYCFLRPITTGRRCLYLAHFVFALRKSSVPHAPVFPAREELIWTFWNEWNCCGTRTCPHISCLLSLMSDSELWPGRKEQEYISSSDNKQKTVLHSLKV